MIGNKYNLIEQIGKGSFGEIYKGINTLTKEIVAIKIEPHVNETKLLKNETKISTLTTPELFPEWIPMLMPNKVPISSALQYGEPEKYISYINPAVH